MEYVPGASVRLWGRVYVLPPITIVPRLVEDPDAPSSELAVTEEPGTLYTALIVPSPVTVKVVGLVLPETLTLPVGSQ